MGSGHPQILHYAWSYYEVEMQRWIQTAFLLLAAGTSFAQHPGLPPISPIPSMGGSGRPAPAPMRAVRPGSGFYSLPFYGGYDSGYAPTNIVVIQQPPAYVVVEKAAVPQAPVQSVIREYKDAGPAETTAAFGIVLKDGSTRDAIAVTVQDRVLHYVDADGAHFRLPVENVDRDATRRVNRERKLNLQLP